MKYDATIIEEFSGRLYKKATSVVATYVVMGVFIGLVTGAVGKATGMLIGAVVFGVVGYSIGNEKAFQYRLQAQTALCQVQIEKNTRAPGA